MEKNEMMHTMSMQDQQMVNGGSLNMNPPDFGEVIGKVLDTFIDMVTDQLKRYPAIS